jgi:hypothetical protein
MRAACHLTSEHQALGTELLPARKTGANSDESVWH